MPGSSWPATENFKGDFHVIRFQPGKSTVSDGFSRKTVSADQSPTRFWTSCVAARCAITVKSGATLGWGESSMSLRKLSIDHGDRP
jgi:hypothetical protein